MRVHEKYDLGPHQISKSLCLGGRDRDSRGGTWTP